MDVGTVTSVRLARERADLVLADGEDLLGGGTWTYSEPQPRTTGVVDLTTMGWDPVVSTREGLEVAGTCTVAELVAFAERDDRPGLSLVRPCADGFLMSFKIWNLATVGGNLALALPAGAMISLTAGLDAIAVIWTPEGGERRERVVDLVRDAQRTSLARGEVIRSVVVPSSTLRARTAYRKLALTALGRSSAVVTGRLEESGRAVLVVTASTPRPVELVFDAVPSSDVVEEAWSRIDRWYDDPHGPADWRRAITRGLLLEVVEELGA